MSYNISSGWKGTVGVIKPTYRPFSLQKFIRLLPEGIGVIPKFLGIKSGKRKEFMDALELTKNKIAELAELKVDLIHPEGAPVFVFRGYKGAQKIVRELEQKHGIPIFTTIMTITEALEALGAKRIIGVTYSWKDGPKDKFERYFNYFGDAGFEVLGMESISVPTFADIPGIHAEAVYDLVKKLYLKQPNAQGIYMMGSGWWRILDIIEDLEQDLKIPVVHPIAARVWAVQKRLHVNQPIKGYGRLLAELP